MFHQQIILPLSHTHLCFDTKSSHRVISNIQINKSVLLQSLLKYCAIFVNCNLRSSFGYSIFADNMILIAPAVSSKLSKTTLKHADTNICLSKSAVKLCLSRQRYKAVDSLKTLVYNNKIIKQDIEK